MLESEVKALKGTYPNIIFKKKLVPLPLFNQNRHDLPSLSSSPSKEKSVFGSITPRPDLQASALVSPRKPFLNEFKTVNNYGRLCDQPFLEFSNFHSEQVFGAGSGKKKIVLEPITKKKQKITKMFTLRDSLIGRSTFEFGKSSLIKVQDYATAAPQITINQKPKEKVKDKNKQKENQAVIKKVYKIGDYEAIVGFYSLEVVLTCGEAETQKTFSLRIGKDKLRKLFKFSHSEMTTTVLESLVFKDGKLKMKLTKEAKQDRYIGDETYPQKKENLTATIDGQEYKATIHFPYLEVSISKLDYHEKVMLKPLFLANLYEENFNNLQDYIQKFTLPDLVTKTKEEIHHEELKKLPTIIKKVVKTVDFGGLVLFKSLEVHLKNTSELEPETIMHESSLTPMNQKIMRKKKKDINAVLLRLKLDEVLKLLKCSAEEITEFVKDSLCVEEGTGFEVKLDQEKLNNHHQRDKHEPESYPEFGEKFTIRFNRFIYEGYLKFPTLELYIPETNYKDVIQLKPYQLRDLIEDEFKNIESYLHYFKKPNTEPVHLAANNLNIGDETPREFVQSIEIRTGETPMATKETVITSETPMAIKEESIETNENEINEVPAETNENEALAETKETPAEANEEPVETNETPVETNENEAPVEANEEPVETNEEPVETTEVPVETNETPIEANEAPVETNETPVETNEVPVETNENEAPIETNEEPIESNETPIEANEAPAEAKEEHIETNETPIEANEVPVETTEAPAETNEAPIESNENEAPIEAKDEPVEANEAPVETNEVPVETNETPVETNEVPVETTEAPIETNENEAPVETKEEPVETNEVPVETTEAPAETNEAAVETNEAPVETKEEPIGANENETPMETNEAPVSSE